MGRRNRFGISLDYKRANFITVEAARAFAICFIELFSQSIENRTCLSTESYGAS